jgi:hypothetical protein
MTPVDFLMNKEAIQWKQTTPLPAYLRGIEWVLDRKITPTNAMIAAGIGGAGTGYYFGERGANLYNAVNDAAYSDGIELSKYIADPLKIGALAALGLGSYGVMKGNEFGKKWGGNSYGEVLFNHIKRYI